MNKTFIALALALMCASTVYTTCNADAMAALLTSADADDAGTTTTTSETSYSTVTISTTVSTDGFEADGICGSIWTEAGGTCCTQSEIQARADALEARLRARFTARKEAIENAVEGTLSDLSETNVQLSAKLTILATLAAGSDRRVLQSGAASATTTNWAAVLTAAAEGSADFSSLSDEAESQFGACVEELFLNRVKTWCFACANEGTFDAFWDSGTSLLQVTEETCNSIVTKCSKPLSFLKRMVQVEAVKKNIQVSLGGTITGDNLEVETSADFEADIECGSDSSACADSDTARQAFCQKIAFNVDTADIYGDGNFGTVDITAFPTPSTE